MWLFWPVMKSIDCFLSQTGLATFWATFRKTWATFYLSIWSHCLGDKVLIQSILLYVKNDHLKSHKMKLNCFHFRWVATVTAATRPPWRSAYPHHAGQAVEVASIWEPDIAGAVETALTSTRPSTTSSWRADPAIALRSPWSRRTCATFASTTWRIPCSSSVQDVTELATSSRIAPNSATCLVQDVSLGTIGKTPVRRLTTCAPSAPVLDIIPRSTMKLITSSVGWSSTPLAGSRSASGFMSSVSGPGGNLTGVLEFRSIKFTSERMNGERKDQSLIVQSKMNW